MPAGGTISSLGSSFAELVRGANESREAVAQLGGELNRVSQTTQRNAQMIAAVVDTLTQNMTGIKTEVEKVVQALTNFNSVTSRGRSAIQQEVATLDDMWEAYKKMGVEVENLNLEMKTLTFTQKEINKVVQLGTEYNDKRIDSYTALSQKYRAVKILIDQMTVSERENTEQGRAFVAMARDMYEQMNILQQRTGKYQLQVGDYSKAMTGLNIATNQVIRELPVLANGVSMFAIAISNNIPILVDNIVQVRRANAALSAHKKELLEAAAAAKAQGDMEKYAAISTEANSIKTMSVIKGLAASIFSWQTAIVLVLSVLPGLIRNIEKKKKETEAASRATKEAIEYEKLLANAYSETEKEQVRSVTKMQTLYYITQDNLRSQDDRIKAARILKEEFKDEFANLSEEEILLGKAKQAYDNLTNSLLQQAKARAYLNKITELYEQMIDQQAIRDTAKARKEAADAEVQRLTILDQENRVLDDMGNYYSEYSADLGKAKKEQEAANQAFLRADMPLQDIDNAILKLKSDIPVDGLWDEIFNGGRKKGGKEQGMNLPDYYYEMLQASAEALPFILDRQLAVRETAWFKERDGYAKQIGALAEMREKANEDEREEINQQIQYLLQLLRMGQDKFDADMKQIIRDRVNSYAEEVVEDVIDEDIPGKITKEWNRRGRKYGGVVEAILAQTKKYGEGNKFGQGILKDEYVNFVTSVDQALKTSMQYMDDWMEKRIQMAEIAVKAAEKEVDAAHKVLDYEMEARANGYANRVETARKELDLARQNHKKALDEQKRLEQAQLAMEAASQISSLVTATANIWAAMTRGTGLLGPALAVAATSLMWGSFAASKIKAAQLAQMRSEQYGEGTVELLEGGSHASGHDIDLGTKRDGTRRRAEGGEFFAIINKKNSRRYRSVIPDVIRSFNDGTFADKYQRANQAMGNFALGVMAGNSATDVSTLEREVKAIREQGEESRYMDSKGNLVIRYKNLTRKING